MGLIEFPGVMKGYVGSGLNVAYLYMECAFCEEVFSCMFVCPVIPKFSALISNMACPVVLNA